MKNNSLQKIFQEVIWKLGYAAGWSHITIIKSNSYNAVYINGELTNSPYATRLKNKIEKEIFVGPYKQLITWAKEENGKFLVGDLTVYQ